MSLLGRRVEGACSPRPIETGLLPSSELLLSWRFGRGDEQPTPILGAVRSVWHAGLHMQRRASLVLLALVDEVALNDVKYFGDILV